jgi:hypothetical protein
MLTKNEKWFLETLLDQAEDIERLKGKADPAYTPRTRAEIAIAWEGSSPLDIGSTLPAFR